MNLQGVLNYLQDLLYLKLFPVINKLVIIPFDVRLIVAYHLRWVIELGLYCNTQELPQYYLGKIAYIMSPPRKSHYKSRVSFL